jgi:hypothetical protein
VSGGLRKPVFSPWLSQSRSRTCKLQRQKRLSRPWLKLMLISSKVLTLHT